MPINTAIPKNESSKVDPGANEKAAPEFRAKFNWKNEPRILTAPRCESALTAQILEAKSKIQMSQATLNSVRQTRTVSAVLPSAYRACTM